MSNIDIEPITSFKTIAKKVTAEDLKVGMNLNPDQDGWSEIYDIERVGDTIVVNKSADPQDYSPTFEVGQMVYTYRTVDNEFSDAERIEQLEARVNELIGALERESQVIDFILDRAGLSR